MAKTPNRKIDKYYQTIEEELPFVDLKPYSHNIISLTLMAIYKGYGKSAANKAVLKFKLNKLGWSTK